MNELSLPFIRHRFSLFLSRIDINRFRSLWLGNDLKGRHSSVDLGRGVGSDAQADSRSGGRCGNVAWSDG
jgi:hypothetical protein